MKPKERVGISEVRVSRAPEVLVTYGLGSCLGIALYEPVVKMGGLAHTLLPAPRGAMGEMRPTKFVPAAIRIMISELCAQGADRDRIQAKLVGGATMFEPLHPGQSEEGIGARNIRAARETLAELGIAVLAEDVGGNHGRTVEFDLDTGEVRVRSVRGSDKLIIL